MENSDVVSDDTVPKMAEFDPGLFDTILQENRRTQMTCRESARKAGNYSHAPVQETFYQV